MAKITEIQFSMGYTLQPRNYEAARVEASVTVEITEGETPEDAAHTAQNFVRRQILAALAPTIALMPVDRQEVYYKQLAALPLPMTMVEVTEDDIGDEPDEA